MPTKGKTITILVAEDDEDDRLLMQDALEENRLANDLHFVGDGEELMDYLRHQGDYIDPKSSPRPSLILLVRWMAEARNTLGDDAMPSGLE